MLTTEQRLAFALERIDAVTILDTIQLIIRYRPDPMTWDEFCSMIDRIMGRSMDIIIDDDIADSIQYGVASIR